MDSLIPLTPEEWEKIDNELPAVGYVINRVNSWTEAEWLNSFDFELLKRLRLSRVRFHDTIEKLRYARVALGEAIGIREYYLQKSVRSVI